MDPIFKPRPKLWPAGLVVRVQAFCIDALLLVLLGAPFLWLSQHRLVSRLDDFSPTSLFVNWLLPAIYFIGFWRWQGASFGMLFSGIRVVDFYSGEKPTLKQTLLRWVGAVVSLLPLGLGLWWSAVDARGQSWHDRLAGTQVVWRRARAEGEPEELGYLLRHWRGEQGLAQSFWVNNLLLATPLAMLITGLMSWIGAKGEHLQASAIAVIVGWPLMLALDTWCVVGAWRSAGNYLRHNGAALWGYGARLLMGLGMLQVAASLLVGFLPQLGEYWQMARGIDPIGRTEFHLAEDGTSVRMEGPIGMGDATRLDTLMKAQPQLQRFELQSPGGRLYEAERMAEMISGRSGASAWVVEHCESACTILFLAAPSRQLMPEARLGFHRASSGTYNPVFDELANKELEKTYRKLNLPDYFIKRTLKTPSRSMWYPSMDELISHALIPEPPKTLDIFLPPGADSPLKAYVEALRANPAWYALEGRFSGSIEQAAQRMQAARQAQLPEDAVQAAGYMVAAEQMGTLVHELQPVLRHQLVRQVEAQLRAAKAQSPEACQGLLGGQLILRRLLPLELHVTDSHWMQEAANSPRARRSSNVPTPVELEVVRRRLGPLAPGMLAHWWGAQPGVPAAPRCEQVLQILDQLGRLPVQQRELAERLMFQRPA